MRVCKVVREEVAELFYGGHEFRFNCANGFTALAFWLHTIGPSNRRHLRHIMVELPIPPGLGGPLVAMNLEEWRRLENELTRRGMRIPDWTDV